MSCEMRFDDYAVFEMLVVLMLVILAGFFSDFFSALYPIQHLFFFFKKISFFFSSIHFFVVRLRHFLGFSAQFRFEQRWTDDIQ